MVRDPDHPACTARYGGRFEALERRDLAQRLGTHAVRSRELAALIEDTRGGHGRAVVVRGDAGIGKTTLIDRALQTASDVRIVRTDGVEAERELGFAALHRLCAHLFDRIDVLPPPQRDALSAIFGVSAGGPPDLLFVGLAVLTLFSEIAERQPLICVVDDAQWIDPSSAQVLAFVARRLNSVRVALFFAAREVHADLAGLPEMAVEGLSDAESRELLASVVPSPIDPRVRDRIIAEAQGNPRALVEFRHATTPADMAGGFSAPPNDLFAQRSSAMLELRLEAVTEDTRQLLLVAAVEPEGNAKRIWGAVKWLDLDARAATLAESHGLVRFAERVTFLDPHLRSAVYRAATPDERRRAHHALAETIDADIDPDRRAWHRAHAEIETPNAAIADELERWAGKARERGGQAAMAAFLEQAVSFTPDADRRNARAFAAARARLDAGSPHAAADLLATVCTGPLSEIETARLERLRADIASALRRTSDAASLIDAAGTLERLGDPNARETHLQALEAALFAGRLGRGQSLAAAAEAALAAAPPSGPPRASDFLLDGLAASITQGHEAGVDALRRAVESSQVEGETCWLPLAGRAATELWDFDATHALATHHLELANNAGSRTRLALALNDLAELRVHAGDFSGASDLVAESDAHTDAIGHARVNNGAFVLAAWRGDEAEAVELLDDCLRDATERGDGRQVAHVEYAAAVLYNGLGRYGAALEVLQPAAEREEDLSCWVLPELVEAAARSGEHEVAMTALKRLSERTQSSGTDWGLGIEARTRALVSDDSNAEQFYVEAIDRLERGPAVAHLARARLLYGEWLRRRRRRVDAREQLRVAHELFLKMGACAFSVRAARELLATGEQARKRTVDTASHLTAQEAEIARLARDGQSNPEIGVQLFISSRTVEYHLRKVFMKLGIRSRNELEHVLPRDAADS